MSRLFVHAGQRAQGVRLQTQSGTQCAAVSVPRGLGHRFALTQQHRTATTNQTHSGGADQDEVAGLLVQMDGVTALLARLLYGTGMRLLE